MFGHWRVVSSEVIFKDKKAYVLVNDEYAERYVEYSSLTSGQSTHSKRYPVTGLPNYGPLRHRWEQIKDRCENPDASCYSRYGQRGIKLSEEFQDVRVFAQYVASLPGYAERKHIDRIDNNRGYERGNLRWATASENNRNKEDLIYVEHDGKRMCLMEFVKNYTSYNWRVVKRRLENGFTTQDIVNQKIISTRDLVCYENIPLRFATFVTRFTVLSVPIAFEMYQKGTSLEELTWKGLCI